MYIVKQFEIKKDHEFFVLTMKVGDDTRKEGNQSGSAVPVASECCQRLSKLPKVNRYVLTKPADEQRKEKRRS